MREIEEQQERIKREMTSIERDEGKAEAYEMLRIRYRGNEIIKAIIERRTESGY